MIAWLAPAGFGALAALALPLLIHWLRRSDRRVLSFAALQYLREQPHPREERTWHERVLLLLRLALLATLALLLAWPVWRSAATPPAPPASWVIVAPGIDATAAHAAIGELPRAEWRWLAPGAGFSSALRELDATLPPGAAVTVLVPEELAGLDAERLRLTHAVRWRAVPGGSPAVAAAARPALTLAVRYDRAGAAELGVIRAVAAAWAAAGEPATVDYATSEAPLPPASAWLVWLAGPLPPRVDAWLRAGGRALASRQADGGGAGGGGAGGGGPGGGADGVAAPLFRERQIGRGTLLSSSAALVPDALPAVRTARFPEELRARLSRPSEPPDRAPAASVVPSVSDERVAAPGRPLDTAFAFAAALLFLVERVSATRRRA
jgi:hypothetical protein